MATKRRKRSLGKLYKRAPKDCSCGKGEKVLVGKFGVRCMRVKKIGGRKRFIYSKTSPKCNK